MDRLTPLADAFLEAEDADPHASLAIGSLAVFAGPAPDFAEFRASIAGRLPLIPRYRQRLHRVAFDLAPPAWVDDPSFDVRQHVRRRAVPAPGGRAELAELVSSLMTERMDRSRPLWDYWFVEGLPGGRWAVLSKLHHSMVDGVSGSDLYHLVLDPTPEPRPPVPDDWAPAAPPSRLSFTADAARELALTPVRATRGVADALRHPGRLARTATWTAGGLATLAGALRPGPRSSLTGPIGGQRRYAWAEVSLDDIRGVRKAYGVTVNDVALAAVAGGFRRLLLGRGETPEAHTLRTLVPVSTREPGAESIPDNRVSLMLPYLPVDLTDPGERLAAVHERIRHLRAAHEPEAGGVVTTVAGYGAFPPVKWGIRLGMSFPQWFVDTVATNVPGPRETLYCLGREAEQLLPYVPIADQVRVGIAIFSYRDVLTFGITGDHETTPDLDVLAEGIVDSLSELVGASR
jgi:diacylglycerol O-acyltransferase